MDISIIICTYNRCRSLATVLESIRNLNVPAPVEWETLVIDNNSSDATREVVKRFSGSDKGYVRYIFEGRQGKSYALNTGINAARGDILAFTDDDVTVHQDWVRELLKIFNSHDCRGVGGKIIPVFAGGIPSWLRLEPPFLNPLVAFDLGAEPCVLTKEPFGANMAFRRGIFGTYGLFRTDLGPVEGNPMGKGEDSEFCSRLLAAGEPMMYAADAIVYHPVDENRLRKKYFETWFFNFGKASIARAPAVPERVARLFGTPRYLYRRLASKWLAWQFTFDGHRRFCRKLELCQAIGQVVESARKNREPRSVASVKQQATTDAAGVMPAAHDGIWHYGRKR